MKRKLSSGILVLILTLSLFANIAVAAPGQDDHDNAAYRAVVNANRYIAREVARAQVKAAAIIEDMGETVEAEERVLDVIERLVYKTNKRAAKTIEFCAKRGVEVECEFQSYIIGEQPVLIDPLFICSD